MIYKINLNLENSTLKSDIHLELCILMVKQVIAHTFECLKECKLEDLLTISVIRRQLLQKLNHLKTTSSLFANKREATFQIVGYVVKQRSKTWGMDDKIVRTYNEENLNNVPLTFLLSDLITIIQGTLMCALGNDLEHKIEDREEVLQTLTELKENKSKLTKIVELFCRTHSGHEAGDQENHLRSTLLLAIFFPSQALNTE